VLSACGRQTFGCHETKLTDSPIYSSGC
jgi:hypothetical protein